MNAHPRAPLGEVCEVLDKLRKPIKKGNRVSGEYPYYGATGIVDWVADYIFDEKLVLVGEDGAKWGVGDRTAFVAEGKYWVNNHAHVLRPIGGMVTHEWLAYYLTSIDLLPWVAGLTVPKLNQARLRSIPIPLPPLDEQRRIVGVLNRAARIERLRGRAQELMAEFIPALFVRMFGDPVENPMGWEIPMVAIGELCNLINGRAFKPTDWVDIGMPIVRIQNLRDPSKPMNKFDGRVQDKFLIDSGDILLSWSGTPGTSFGCFIWDRGRAILNQHIFRVDYDSSRIERDFFVYAMNSRIDEMIARAHGGVGLRHITKSELNKIKLPLPPLKEQRRFAEIAGKAQAALARADAGTRTASALSASLASRLLGEGG